MERAGFVARMWEWLTRRKPDGCPHDLVTHFTAEVFTRDGWERCTGVAFCTRCDGEFTVFVPADKNDMWMSTTEAIG